MKQTILTYFIHFIIIFFFGYFCGSNKNTVVIFLGHRLHDLQINTGISGTETTCGFYEGPAVTGERIAVYCTSGVRGSYILMTILSRLDEMDVLNICELQAFVNN